MATSESPNAEPKWEIPAALRRELLTALFRAPIEKPKMTYDEFLDWLDEDTLAEWVDGEVVTASPASLRHQLIVNFLLETLGVFNRVHHLGQLIDGPFQMKLPASGREPDVIFVATEHLDRLRPTYLDGPADLVVEVVSPESAGRDRGDKFYEYQSAGIPEYWLIDPQTEHAEFYRLSASGVYSLAPLDADGVYHSRVVPGYWLRESWLWQETLPNVEDALLEIDPDAYSQHLLDKLRQHGFLSE